jgi:t-SNARE complex subunit (syntaxin)
VTTDQVVRRVAKDTKDAKKAVRRVAKAAKDARKTRIEKRYPASFLCAVLGAVFVTLIFIV